jgi:hypothetical protein
MVSFRDNLPGCQNPSAATFAGTIFSPEAASATGCAEKVRKFFTERLDKATLRFYIGITITAVMLSRNY